MCKSLALREHGTVTVFSPPRKPTAVAINAPGLEAKGQEWAGGPGKGFLERTPGSEADAASAMRKALTLDLQRQCGPWETQGALGSASWAETGTSELGPRSPSHLPGGGHRIHTLHRMAQNCLPVSGLSSVPQLGKT